MYRATRLKLGLQLLICCVATEVSQAQTFVTLATFAGAIGIGPNASLVQGSDGNFYGTTSQGLKGYGSVFKVTPSGTVSSLYDFCSASPTFCADGSLPVGALVQGSDGNFYGVTAEGGDPNQSAGTIFKITAGGSLTTLYRFCAQKQSPCPDGSAPTGGLVQGADGSFYGTTQLGGANSGGTAFKITPGGVFTTVHTFCIRAFGPCPDGSEPNGGLIVGSDGNFYGTSYNGGANENGNVFVMTPNGQVTTLYSFCPLTLISADCPDGRYPNGRLVQGFDGSFYGTTQQLGQGSQSQTGNGKGTAFKITSSGQFATIYIFCAAGDSCPDGEVPNGGLVQVSDGSFYGTTQQGGSGAGGSIFQITSGGALTTVYSFCSKYSVSACAGGSDPVAGLTMGSDGNLYGTTSGGALGANLPGGNLPGTVFRLQAAPGSGFVCANTIPPVITSVNSASAYGGYSYFASGSWLEIKGTDLADPADPRLANATNPGQWTSADFRGSSAPTSLDGISVSINGKRAYVWYLSMGQLNVQAPDDTASGNVAVTVTNCKATSPPFIFARWALAPGFLAPANYTANGTQYMLATFQSDGAYVLNTATGATYGLTSRPAKPGDGIIAYGVGFGDVTPSILPGGIAGASNTLVNPVLISFGTTNATIAYQGLAGGFVGLYEFYMTVPSTLANGDYQIGATQNGTAVPQTIYLTVHN
jgi:uncharacterized protein (TIGR03437 family)